MQIDDYPCVYDPPKQMIHIYENKMTEKIIDSKGYLVAKLF